MDIKRIAEITAAILAAELILAAVRWAGCLPQNRGDYR